MREDDMTDSVDILSKTGRAFAALQAAKMLCASRLPQQVQNRSLRYDAGRARWLFCDLVGGGSRWMVMENECSRFVWRWTESSMDGKQACDSAFYPHDTASLFFRSVRHVSPSRGEYTQAGSWIEFYFAEPIS